MTPLAGTMKCVLLLSAVVAVSAQATASATVPEPLQRATHVASDHWPGSPCHGHEVILYRSTADFDARYPHESDEIANARDPELPSCTVNVDLGAFRTLGSSAKCLVLEHEFGHLAGVEHSLDPDSVMYPVIDLLYADFTTDCARAFTRWPKRRRPSAIMGRCPAGNLSTTSSSTRARSTASAARCSTAPTRRPTCVTKPGRSSACRAHPRTATAAVRTTSRGWADLADLTATGWRP